MVDVTILTAIVVVIVTVLLYFLKPLFACPNAAVKDTSKPRTKEELLSARVKHFEKKVVDITNDAESKQEQTSDETNNMETLAVVEDTPHLEQVKETEYDLGDVTLDISIESTSKENANEEKEYDGKGNDGKENDGKESEGKENNGKESDGKGNDGNENGETKQRKRPNVHYLHTSSFPLSTLQPEIKPLKSLEELLSWMPGYDEASVGKIFRRPVTPGDKSKPKTMICHDMKGGYIQDRFVQGCDSHECYRINQWSLIDSFCYFSHSFVTLPPPCWTNAAHNNGVKVLGTVITEWDGGAAICTEMLKSVDSIDKVVEKLVDIAAYYKFEGWLINIENPITLESIGDLRYFVSKLTQTMHSRIPDSEVIWYDSVTKSGELKWQNKLCNDNKLFFDACDGIFLNYNWSENDLRLSGELAGTHRRHDVYVGVDVFGRGCFGGGGWNTNKAMEVIRNQNLSAAIFAPGWVMEKYPVSEFREQNEKFWNLIREYLYAHCVTKLPLVSTFCEGYGNQVFICGQKMTSQMWTNLSATSLLPNFNNSYYNLGHCNSRIIIGESGHSCDVGFIGGGCYCIKGSVTTGVEQCKTVFRLFETRIAIKPGKDYLLSYTYQSSSEAIELCLLLVFDDRPNYMVFVPPETSPCPNYTIPATQEGNYVEILPHEECINCHNEVKFSKDWITRNYKFKSEQPGKLKEIRLALISAPLSDDLGETKFTVSLGEVRLHHFSDLTTKIPSACTLKCYDVNMRGTDEEKWVSFTLSWELGEGKTLPKCFDIFCSGVDGQQVSCKTALSECLQTTSDFKYGIHVGRSYTDFYYVQDLIVPTKCSGGLCIAVQAVSYADIRQSWEDSAQIVLKW